MCFSVVSLVYWDHVCDIAQARVRTVNEGGIGLAVAGWADQQPRFNKTLHLNVHNARNQISEFEFQHHLNEIVCIHSSVYKDKRLEKTALCTYILKNLQSQCKDAKTNRKKSILLELNEHVKLLMQIIMWQSTLSASMYTAMSHKMKYVKRQVE